MLFFLLLSWGRNSREMLYNPGRQGETMSSREIMQRLMDDQTIESVLKRGSASKEAIQALQNLLYEMGFDVQLNWDKYGADGVYGSSTTNAVRAFAERNGLSGSGETVTLPIAAKLLSRYDALDDLRQLYDAARGNKVEELFFRGAPHSDAVVALQTVLNELGFGAELNWEKYGADGVYGGGTTNAVKAFAQQEGIPGDGSKLTPELARRIVDKLGRFYGEHWTKETAPAESASGNLLIREAIEEGRARVYVSRGAKQVRFTKFKNGVYVYGNQKPIDFINANKSSLSALGLGDSAIRVMLSVSENEGNLDGVNTWDNSFMTFGMFQWTIGAGNDPGELPALLEKIKSADGAAFQKYYGQYGLDVVNADEASGYLSLNGEKIATSSGKELLRTYEWAFFFWLSGQDPLVQSIETQHALGRIRRFYRSDAYRVKGFHISDLLTSEYGVALVLDNHVNRPGYVKSCLEKAMDETALSNPGSWSTAEERKLIGAYLKVRETYGSSPMTDAGKRAAVTKKYLDNGTISGQRGSFSYIL